MSGVKSRCLPLVALWALALPLATSSCGRSTNDQSSGDGSGASSSGSSYGAAAGGSDGADDMSVDDSVDLRVDIVSSVFSHERTMRVVASSAPLDQCEEQSDGGCVLRVCPVDHASPQTQEFRHAGQVTASFEAMEESLVAVVTPDSAGSYSLVDFEPLGPTLLGEEIGLVTASGGDIDAFAQEVTFPLLLLNTLPAVSNGLDYEIPIPRTNDFVLTWDRGSEDIFYLLQPEDTFDDGTLRHRLSCIFPSADGEGTIPGVLLSQVPLGGVLRTYTVAQYDQTVKSDVVRVRVIAETTVPEKTGRLVLRLLD